MDNPEGLQGEKMEQTMAISMPVEVQVSNPVTPTIPEINTDPLAFQQELAKIAAEQGMKIENGNAVPVQEPTTPVPAVVQPVAATTQPSIEVPIKFQTQEGQPDVQKIEKSTIHAEEALRRYQAIEKELRQTQAEVNKLKTQPPQAAVPTYISPPQQSINPWAQTQYQAPLNPQMINEALAKGNPGQVLMELQQMTFNAAYEQAKQDNETKLASLQSRIEAKERQNELQQIAETDPWVFTDDGINKLGAIRQSKPWLNYAPEPWVEAYKSHLADKQFSPAPQVQTPIPQGQTVKAPATPVQATGRTQSPQIPSLGALSNDKGALNQFLDRLTPQQQQEFWRTAIGAK